jgi:hypothetical protein
MVAKPTRIPIAFHETLSLSRKSISEIARVVSNDINQDVEKKAGKRKIFEEKTDLGNNYVKAMPVYAMGCGLISREYVFSPFGRFALLRDSNFDLISTQWMMHYHMSAPQGPGPIFWNQVVSKFFYPGNIFSSEEIVDFIGNFYQDIEHRTLSVKAVKSTVTIFLGTYIKPEGLGKLRILETTDSGRFRVQTPTLPSAWVIAYALLDFWEAHYSGRISVSLDTLKDSGFIKLFLMAKSDLDEALQNMQEIRYVEVHRAAPPYQVVLLRQDQEPILDKLYGSN